MADDKRPSDENRATVKLPAALPRPMIGDAPPPILGTVPAPPIVRGAQPSMTGFRGSLPSFSEVAPEAATDTTLAPVLTGRAPIDDRAVLTVLRGISAGQVVALDEGELVIGRGREATMRLEDVGISRRHARLYRNERGQQMVEDLGSTNGTFVDGKRIERHWLRPGDRLQLGSNILLRYALVDSAEEELARQLFEASTRDPLTRAYNRRYFMERLAAEVAYTHRHGSPVGVLLIDIDHFKTTNDTHGHLAGDLVLRAVAFQVAKTIRIEDVFARYGGEEFAILVRGIDGTKLSLFGERVRRAVEQLSVPWNDAKLGATISVGVATLAEVGGESASGEMMLVLADERLYRAKAAGRNRVCAS